MRSLVIKGNVLAISEKAFSRARAREIKRRSALGLNNLL